MVKLKVLPYKESWPEQFNVIRSQLEEALPAGVITIEHIGSTAVPGLAAKPIVDILIGATNIGALNNTADTLAELPNLYYVPYWEDVMPFRRFFIQTVTAFQDAATPKVIRDRSWNDIPHTSRLAHIHATTKEHPFFREHLEFRDILRKNEQLRQAYENLKLELSGKEWESGADYADAKAVFIEAVLRKQN